MENNEIAVPQSAPQQKAGEGFWTKHKPNSIIKVPTLDIGFFKWWLIYMGPIAPLTGRELDVVANFLKLRQSLTKIISDPSIVDSVLMNSDSQKKVLEESKITQSNFYVVMSNLKKKGVIKNGAINPKLLPNIRKTDNGVYQLLILFEEEKENDL